MKELYRRIFLWKKIDVIEMCDGKKMVIIHDVIFKKKEYVKWKEVREYLKKFVGEVYAILSAQESVYIGPVLLVRHAEDGEKYLYDIIDIKKETSYPLEQ